MAERKLGYNKFRLCSVYVYRKLFPASKCLFMYRGIVETAKSTYRLTMVLPSVRLVYLLGKLHGQLTKIMIDTMGFDGSDFCERVDNGLMLGVFLSAMTTTSYLNMRQRGFDVRALSYEELVARPLDMCRVILEFCNLPVSLAELAVRAFDVDSQRNCVQAKSVIGHFKEPQMTPQIQAKLNSLLERFGLPLIGEPGIIEGSLTCS